MPKYNVPAALFIAVLFCGCAEIHINTETDPNYPSYAAVLGKRIIVDSITNRPTISERKLVCLFEKCLSSNGYEIVSSDDNELPDYWLLISSDIETRRSSGSIPVPVTSSSSGSVGGTLFNSTTKTTQFIPYTSSSTYKTILFYLCVPDERSSEGRLLDLWSGYAFFEDCMTKQSDKVVEAIVEKIGQDFDGSIYLQEQVQSERNYR